MFGLKAIAVILAIGAIAPSHASPGGLGGLTGGLTGGGGPVGGLTGGDGPVGGLTGGLTGGDGLLGGILGGEKGEGLLGGILGGESGGLLDLDPLLDGLLGKDKTDILGVVNYIVKDLLKLKIPGVIDDVSKLLFNLGKTLQKLLDKIIPGLGTSLGKIIFGLAKIVFCDLGSPGLTGSLLGRTPGSAAPNLRICKYCDKSLGLPGDADGDCVRDVIQDGVTECEGHLKKIKKGDKQTGLLKIVIDLLNKLLGIGKKCSDDDYDITAGDFAEVVGQLTIFYGACGNHYGKNKEGDGLIDLLNKLLKALLGPHGYDCNKYKKVIKGCHKGPGLEELPKCFH